MVIEVLLEKEDKFGRIRIRLNGKNHKDSGFWLIPDGESYQPHLSRGSVILNSHKNVIDEESKGYGEFTPTLMELRNNPIWRNRVRNATTNCIHVKNGVVTEVYWEKSQLLLADGSLSYIDW